ncbi:MAG: hypothetical protein J5657_05685 [Clostridiales bacterium]|nr:hypothetical protein [Clostridiales bacterium]
MILYMLVQCTWGILQTLAGFVTFLLNIRRRHFLYHGAVVTEWKLKSSVSLGLFVFVAEDPNFIGRFKDRFTREEMKERLLVHEYGHTIQSLILGPLYLFVMGVPSALWGALPPCYKMRRRRHMSYFWFFTERWANYLGEKVTKTKSMERLFID